MRRDGRLTEAFAISLFYCFAEEQEVFRDKHSILGQEREKTFRLSSVVCCLLSSNQRNTLLPVTAELVVYLEGADAVHLIAKEVDAVWQFVREGIDVDDAATNGKLPRLIDVIRPVEAEAEQRLLHEHDIHPLPYAQAQSLLAEFLLRYNKFGESLGVRHDEERQTSCRESGEHFRSEDFLSGIALAELDGSLVAAWEEEHLVVAQESRQVVIEIASLFLVIKHKDIRHIQHLRSPFCQRSEHKRSTTSLQSGKLYRLIRPLLQFCSKGFHARMPCKDAQQFLNLHLRLQRYE